MFFRRRSCHPFLKLLLLLFGFKLIAKDRKPEIDHDKFLAKRRKFRTKIREAFEVWDEDVPGEPPHKDHTPDATGDKGV